MKTKIIFMGDSVYSQSGRRTPCAGGVEGVWRNRPAGREEWKAECEDHERWRSGSSTCAGGRRTCELRPADRISSGAPGGAAPGLWRRRCHTSLLRQATFNLQLAHFPFAVSGLNVSLWGRWRLREVELLSLCFITPLSALGSWELSRSVELEEVRFVWKLLNYCLEGLGLFSCRCECFRVDLKPVGGASHHCYFTPRNEFSLFFQLLPLGGASEPRHVFF